MAALSVQPADNLSLLWVQMGQFMETLCLLVLAALPELSLQIVELVREHGRITMGDAIKLTGGNRNTLKQHFRALVEQGHLKLRGSGRGVWYELR